MRDRIGRAPYARTGARSLGARPVTAAVDERRFPYEIDGGSRPPMKKPKIKVHPSAITI